MYLLWLFGEIEERLDFNPRQWELLLKLPSVAANLASAYVLYLFLEGRRTLVRLGAPALYLVLPPVLLIGPVWGQVDSVLAFALLLTVYLLARNRPTAAALAYTVGFLTKPQAIAALPFLLFWALREDLPLRTWYRMAGGSLLTTFVLAFPFFPSLLLWRPFVDLVAHVRDSADVFRGNSSFAWNFWNLWAGMAGRCDVSSCRDERTGVTHGYELLGLTTRYWGLLLYLAVAALVILILRRARGPGYLALGTALTVLTFYVFMTRMHERYMFPALLLLLAACAVLRSRALWALFGVLATVHVLNLHYVYVTVPHTNPPAEWLIDWLRRVDLWGAGRPMSFVLLLTLAALLFISYAKSPVGLTFAARLGQSRLPGR